MSSFYQNIITQYKNFIVIYNLAKNDFRLRYVGSYFGLLWTFIQPIVTIIVYWFVFEKGLKAESPVENGPYILWFMTGIIPWFYFSETLSTSTYCLVEYSYLVKKVVFKVIFLPLVKIISNLFVHITFVGLIVCVFKIYGYNPTIYYIQILYYIFCMIFLLVGLSLIASSIFPFFKDIGQIILIILQFGMWLTPIVWPIQMIPQEFVYLFKLNPMYYIVEGYRDTLIYNIWFFQKINLTIYFWFFSSAAFIIGLYVFKKLKPHFADVL